MASRVHCLKRIGENVKKYRTVILEGKDEATIGRSPDATLCILSVMISRCHAILKKSETGAWTIKDNKSLNGVFVNDKKLEPLKPYELNEGDIVQFGVREKPDTQPEFLYRYHTALKLSRKSLNGVFVNDKKLEPLKPYELNEGDIVQFGVREKPDTPPEFFSSPEHEVLKSLNGVFVNDKKLEPLKPYELNEGDIVQFGVREKPDTPPEFLYRYHTALKLSRKSLNGVFVNDKKLEPLKPYELNEGDIVQFGVREKPDTPPEFLYRYHTALKLSRKSLNGVFVNDKKLEPLKPYELNEGDIVQFGVREKPDTPPEFLYRYHTALKLSRMSLNGVFVNDKKLEPLKPYELNEGDIVQFGVREKPDTPPEFLYRYHTALKLSRKVDQTDGPVANSQVKRIKLEGEKGPKTSSVSPSKSKQETSPYQQYRQKIDEQDAQTTAKMSQLEEKLKEMQQLLQEKEAAQQEMAMELQEEKTKRENQSKALECLKKKEEDMQHELVKQQELLTKEKEELESRMREELEDQLQAKEADLMENLENQKTALLKEKEEIENRLKEQLETEREKDKQLADELMQQKQKLEKIIENKEVEKKLLESQLKDTTLEKDQKQEEVLRAREDVLSNFAELMETELQCSICNELFVKATSLNCSHSFCFLCISQWLKVKNECPQCRSAVTTCTKSIVLDSYIEKMVEQFSEDMKRSRQELVEERKKEEAAFEEANKPKPPASRGGRGRGRGRAGRGRGQANTAASTRAPNPTVFNPPPPLPILISDETSDEIDGDNDGFVSLSDEDNSDSDSSVEGDGDVYYGGYGRCYNCGSRGHWANGCPYR